jgi:CO dehydrogenase maturation factor
MRIGFMGKGGSGKTTIASATITYFMNKGLHVMALDGDMNVHLGSVMGVNAFPLALRTNDVANYLEAERGYPIIGTTPPSLNSRFIRVNKDDNFFKLFGTKLKNGNLITIGTYNENDIGSNCYHGKLGILEMILHRTLDEENDIVIADSTAGVDALGTSLFASYDINVFVIEPTLKSISVFNDFKGIGEVFGMKSYTVVNKVMSESDINFIRKHVKDEDVIGYIKQSEFIRDLEQGDFTKINNFAEENKEVFENIYKKAKENKRNWDDYYENLCLLYNKNCEKWYNIYYGQNLNNAIDPNFSYHKVI